MNPSSWALQDAKFLGRYHRKGEIRVSIFIKYLCGDLVHPYSPHSLFLAARLASHYQQLSLRRTPEQSRSLTLNTSWLLHTIVRMNHHEPKVSVVDLTLHVRGCPVVAPLDDLLRILADARTSRDRVVAVALIAEGDGRAARAGQASARERHARERGGHTAEARHSLQLGGLVQDLVVVRVGICGLVTEHSMLAPLHRVSCCAAR